LEQLTDQRPTMIFVDINMPGMDGWEFAKLAAPLLRARPWVSISLLTSSASDHDQRQAQGLSIVLPFLTKPLTVERARAVLGIP
jgi:CheY-like chemotaxis protein